jgi:hypothetical protein
MPAGLTPKELTVLGRRFIAYGKQISMGDKTKSFTDPMERKYLPNNDLAYRLFIASENDGISVRATWEAVWNKPKMKSIIMRFGSPEERSVVKRQIRQAVNKRLQKERRTQTAV